MQFKQNRLLCFILAAILLSGCSQENSHKDLSSYVEKLQTTRSTIEKNILPTKKKPLAPATYDANSPREPFHDIHQGTTKSTSDNTLLSYPISMLRFVGTIAKNKTTYAYVVAPDNMLYQVKEGDLIGDQHGKVIHVYPDKIDIMEEDVEEGRSAIKRIITLQLRTES